MKDLLLLLIRDPEIIRIVIMIQSGSLRVLAYYDPDKYRLIQNAQRLEDVVLFLVSNPEIDGLTLETVRVANEIEFKVSSTVHLCGQDYGVAEILPVHQLPDAEKLLANIQTGFHKLKRKLSRR